MAEKLLNLLNRHAFVNGHCGKRPSKLVRMHLMKTQFTANFAESYLHAADLKSVKWLQQRYEQCLICVCTLGQIALQMNFSPGIKVYFALFISLTENETFPVLKVHITAIEFYKFTNADAGRTQKINHS